MAALPALGVLFMRKILGGGLSGNSTDISLVENRLYAGY